MNLLWLVGFWITEPADSFGNNFISDYPSGISLEVASGYFYGLNISWNRGGWFGILQGGVVGDTVSRSYHYLWGLPIGYYNAFFGVEISDFKLFLGRRTFRLSPTILWDWAPVEGFGFMYRRGAFSYLFYAGQVNGVELPDSEALGPKVYPPGTWVDMAIKRVEVGPFFFGEYGLAILPPDRHLPLSFFNPFRSYLEIQWDEAFDTNTFWFLGFRTSSLYVELGIDDFQYNLSSFTRVPPDFTFHLYRKWFLSAGYVKAEIMYGSPYVFSNRKWASRWVFYNRVPALIEPDQIKLQLSFYSGRIFVMGGMALKGSYTIDMPDPYPDYVLKFPLTPPIEVYPVGKVFVEEGSDRWKIRVGAMYDRSFRLFIYGIAVLYPL